MSFCLKIEFNILYILFIFFFLSQKMELIDLEFSYTDLNIYS